MTDSTNYKARLLDLLYNTRISETQVDNIISLVVDEDVNSTPEEKLERMINLLIESGDSTLAVEGAVGFGQMNQKANDELILRYFNNLQAIFSDICPDYLMNFCSQYETFDFDKVVQDLTETDYVRVENDPLDVWEHLKQMLPNADPVYLRNQARVLVNRPDDLQQFIDNAIEKEDYPTMKDYLIKKEQTDELSVYLTQFSVDTYLEKIPNPIEFFAKPDRKSILLSAEVKEDDVQFALAFLYNRFVFQRQKEIRKVFNNQKRNLYATCSLLKKLPRAFRKPRLPAEELDSCDNAELLQEVAFLKHENLIKQRIRQKNEKYRQAFEEAKKFGLLETCKCCFDDQLIPEDCYFCNKNCTFCKDCVRVGAEHVIGRGESNFPCLALCDSEFSYFTLQMVMDKRIFQRLCQRKQIEEIKSANIDGLETCPFCDFSMIPPEGNKIFKCENLDCLKESCRECRHVSHVPLRCSEIEYDEDVKMRVFIENKMSEALLRKCGKCSKQFYKESGCNKMTCVCGARMCYICGQTITDYSHFGTIPQKCPLYTENLREFHMNRIMQAAQSARSELGVNEVKFDPAKTLVINDVA